jgi:valyl-tRNA synthetase
MQQLVEIIKSIRQSRLEVNTPLSKAIPIMIQAKELMLIEYYYL